MSENQNNPDRQGQDQGYQNQDVSKGRSQMEDDEMIFNNDSDGDGGNEMRDTLNTNDYDQLSANDNGGEEKSMNTSQQDNTAYIDQEEGAKDTYPDEDSGVRNSMGETSHNDMDDDINDDEIKGRM